jgi:hypothetical protein
MNIKKIIKLSFIGCFAFVPESVVYLIESTIPSYSLRSMTFFSKSIRNSIPLLTRKELLVNVFANWREEGCG